MKSEIAVSDAKTGFKGGFTGIIINILMCFLFTVLWLIIFAFVLTYTDFPDKFVSPVVVILTVLSVMLAGFLTAKHRASKGWLTGAFTGILYMLILYILGSAIYNNVSFGINTFAMFALGLISGSFGGILGINLK